MPIFQSKLAPAPRIIQDFDAKRWPCFDESARRVWRHPPDRQWCAGSSRTTFGGGCGSRHARALSPREEVPTATAKHEAKQTATGLRCTPECPLQT